ncbi:RTA1 like protein-domain-containing protein [Aspergillus pseudoustus]|uniref:RTA1 like protein-domain-containing protein n=1 Tax=Aspergillus pseudoustus TaxID=1810923 RepID=A0ABR4IZT1_9EURO
MSSTAECDKISPDCPVEGTIYGYSPDLAVNVAFCAIFSACCLIQFIQALKWRLWSFGIAMILGCFSEAVGYIGRILLHNNPYSSTGFEIQICTLTMGPAFWSAAIYLTLKHEVEVLGRGFSPLQANWYPYIFITCDLISLTLQGAGGGLAASADTDAGTKAGGDVMLAGIVWQVVTLSVFVVVSGVFLFRVKRAPVHRLSVEAQKVWEGTRFWVFFSGAVVAFVTTYARCVYRIAEMGGGWRNHIMQDETGFIVLESVMCAIAVVALSITHPGYFFEQMRCVKPAKIMEDTVLLEQKPSPQAMA